MNRIPTNQARTSDSDSEEEDDSEKLANDDKVSDMDYFKSKAIDVERR